MRTILRLIPLLWLPLALPAQNAAPDSWADWQSLVGTNSTSPEDPL